MKRSVPPAVVKFAAFPNGEIGVVWDDGHDTGIYSFETLRRLCPCDDCSG